MFLGIPISKMEMLLRDTRAATVFGLLCRNEADKDYLELMGSKVFLKPSDNFLRVIFIHSYVRRRKDYEMEMANLKCVWISWDHTFWISKLIHSEKKAPYAGYFIVMNQVLLYQRALNIFFK